MLELVGWEVPNSGLYVVRGLCGVVGEKGKVRTCGSATPQPHMWVAAVPGALFEFI